MLRSLNTTDIEGAKAVNRPIKSPKNIMGVGDIVGTKPSRFKHRWFDKKQVESSAKYDHMFDEYGNRKTDHTVSVDSKIDPLAGSRERRKDQLQNIVGHEKTDFKPVNLNNFRLNRRFYKGFHKNNSNLELKWREKFKNQVSNRNMQSHHKSIDIPQPRKSIIELKDSDYKSKISSSEFDLGQYSPSSSQNTINNVKNRQILNEKLRRIPETIIGSHSPSNIDILKPKQNIIISNKHIDASPKAQYDSCSIPRISSSIIQNEPIKYHINSRRDNSQVYFYTI